MYTFIILKPDTLKQGLVQPVMDYFLTKQIKIERMDYRFVDDALIFAHYQDNILKYGESFKDKARYLFSNQYAIPIILSSDQPDLIAHVREIIGATDPKKAQTGTIRGDLGTDSMEQAMKENRGLQNLIHASDSLDAYLYESVVWFGKAAEKYR